MPITVKYGTQNIVAIIGIVVPGNSQQHAGSGKIFHLLCSIPPDDLQTVYAC